MIVKPVLVKIREDFHLEFYGFYIDSFNSFYFRIVLKDDLELNQLKSEPNISSMVLSP
jgi:hypothetical protein